MRLLRDHYEDEGNLTEVAKLAVLLSSFFSGSDYPLSNVSLIRKNTEKTAQKY